MRQMLLVGVLALSAVALLVLYSSHSLVGDGAGSSSSRSSGSSSSRGATMVATTAREAERGALMRRAGVRLRQQRLEIRRLQDQVALASPSAVDELVGRALGHRLGLVSPLGRATAAAFPSFRRVPSSAEVPLGVVTEGKYALLGAVNVAGESLDVASIKRIDTFPNPLKTLQQQQQQPDLYFAQWKHWAEADKPAAYLAELALEFAPLLCPGSVAVDIGAHAGDTAVPLAAALGTDGLVLAFEPAAPWGVLKVNTWLNAAYAIHAFHFAVDAVAGEWCYYSACGGCNGGKVPCGTLGADKGEVKLVSQRLDEVLARNYDADTVRRISFLKVDTEGFDSAVVRRRGEREREAALPCFAYSVCCEAVSWCVCCTLLCVLCGVWCTMHDDV